MLPQDHTVASPIYHLNTLSSLTLPVWFVCPSPGLTVPSNPCDPTRLFCKSGECIDVDRRCDGRIDCADASDEDNCVVLVDDEPEPDFANGSEYRH